MTPRRPRTPSSSLLLIAICATALLLPFASGCGGAAEEGDTSGARTEGGSGQAARIVVNPRPANHARGQLHTRLKRDAKRAEEARQDKRSSDHESNAGAASFETKGGDNSIQQSGSEAGSTELKRAAAALHGYLDARAAGEWGRACSLLSPALATQLSQLSGSKELPCARALASLSAGLPSGALREAAVADVGALRLDRERAFLLFHGAHGVDYFVPMSREGEEWKLAAIAPSALR